MFLFVVVGRRKQRCCVGRLYAVRTYVCLSAMMKYSLSTYGSSASFARCRRYGSQIVSLNSMAHLSFSLRDRIVSSCLLNVHTVVSCIVSTV